MSGYKAKQILNEARLRNNLKAGEQMLYLELADICNRSNWSEWFECGNRELCYVLFFEKPTLIKAREKLINCGLIGYKKSNKKGEIGKYSILGLNNFTQNDTQNDTPIYKHKHKQKQKINKEKSKKDFSEFDFSFLEKDFEICFMQWLEYKKERREKYKTQKSLELCYYNLKKLSNNNPKIAQEIVNQSLSQNWAGLFELKNNFSKPQQQSQSYKELGINY